MIAVALLLVCGAVWGESFHDPVRLEADGEFISAEAGHSAPWLADFDGDGVRDLLVGQFRSGKLQIYLNKGTDKAPVYGKLQWLQAKGMAVTTPAG